MTDQDLEALVQISRNTFEESFSEGNTRENLMKYIHDQFSPERLAEELKNENSEFYSLYLDHQLAGYLKLNFGPAQTEIRDVQGVEIERIYISKKYQGRKLGQALMDEAIRIARQRRAQYLWLGVWEKNHQAIGFYTKNGFSQFDKHIFVLGDEPQIDLMMRLTLS